MATTLVLRGTPLSAEIVNDNLIKFTYNGGNTMAITSAGLISAVTFSGGTITYNNFYGTTITATNLSATNISGTTISATMLCAATVALTKGSATGVSAYPAVFAGNCVCGCKVVVVSVANVSYYLPALTTTAAT
jgi:hypothetical protein